MNTPAHRLAHPFARRFVLLAMLLFTATGAFALTIPHEAAGIELTIPDTWKYEIDGEVLTIEAPEEGVAFVMGVAGDKEITEVLDELEKGLEKELGPITTGKANEEPVNGMPAWSMLGTAKKGQVEVEFLFVKTPSGQMLFSQYYAAKVLSEKYADQVKSIYDSIKPLPTPPKGRGRK